MKRTYMRQRADAPKETRTSVNKEMTATDEYMPGGTPRVGSVLMTMTVSRLAMNPPAMLIRASGMRSEAIHDEKRGNRIRI